jgi:hypothetical protein
VYPATCKELWCGQYPKQCDEWYSLVYGNPYQYYPLSDCEPIDPPEVE